VGSGINNDNDFMRTDDGGADEGEGNVEPKVDIRTSTTVAHHAKNIELGDGGDGNEIRSTVENIEDLLVSTEEIAAATPINTMKENELVGSVINNDGAHILMI
jgi:hypothetical protein